MPAPFPSARLVDTSRSCPRCAAPSPPLALLTSMMRYYACAHCTCRWTEAVVGTGSRATLELQP